MTINEQFSLSCIEINPKTSAKKSVIWLHGLGADGNDFVPIVSQLNLPNSANIRFIFPHAPIMPVTINNGYEMRAWFDIFELSPSAKIDTTGIDRSIAAILKLIAKEETNGITTDNIILAGFSQGAVIALLIGLRHPKPLGGILALSGFLPQPEKILAEANPDNRNMPIFIAHGTEDMVVPWILGKTTYDALKEAGFNATWHSYHMPHSVCSAEINDMRQWLLNQK